MGVGLDVIGARLKMPVQFIVVVQRDSQTGVSSNLM
jgi:hypothetical protein